MRKHPKLYLALNIITIIVNLGLALIWLFSDDAVGWKILAVSTSAVLILLASCNVWLIREIMSKPNPWNTSDDL